MAARPGKRERELRRHRDRVTLMEQERDIMARRSQRSSPSGLVGRYEPKLHGKTRGDWSLNLKG